MSQTRLDDYWTQGEGGDDPPPDDYLWEPGHQTLTCTIYLYTCARTGDPVYVGQTIQELKVRDRPHRTAWRTVSTAPTSRTVSTC